MDRRVLLDSITRVTGSTKKQIEPFLNQIQLELFGVSGSGGKFGDGKIPPEYANMTLSTSPAKVQQKETYLMLDKYIQAFNRILPNYKNEDKHQQFFSLYFYSNETGTGKTTTACAIAQDYLFIEWKRALMAGEHMHKLPVYFLDVNHLQTLFNKGNRAGIPDDMRSKANKEYWSIIDKAKSADLVVFDDIGVRSPTEAFLADLHDIVNFRVTHKKFSIYTSNVKLDELESIFGRRLQDRIADRNKEVLFVGRSNRGVRR